MVFSIAQNPVPAPIQNKPRDSILGIAEHFRSHVVWSSSKPKMMQWIHIIQVRCSKFKSVQKWSITPTDSRLESSLLESQSISLYNPCVQMLLGSPDHFKTMSRGQRCWKRLWLKLIGLDFRIDIRVYMLCSLFVSHCLHYYAYHISMCIYLYNIDTYQPYIYIYYIHNIFHFQKILFHIALHDARTHS